MFTFQCLRFPSSLVIVLSSALVPTNYRIKVTRDKSKPFSKDDDEDKNLGRWVNRQRSMFQAGKLRKDRQLALETIGLKWSMLATTSWESMFETLCQYVEEKKKGGNEWDGNVPANYRTEDVPPRALGRWINRQRSAYGKSKLKPEYVAKLNEIGLKWSIHERRPAYHQYSRPDSSTSTSAAKINIRKANPSLSIQKTQTTQTKTTPAAFVNASKVSSVVVDAKSNISASNVKNSAAVTNNGKEKELSETKAQPENVASASVQQVKNLGELLATETVTKQQVQTPVSTVAVKTQLVNRAPTPSTVGAMKQRVTTTTATVTLQERNTHHLAERNSFGDKNDAVKTITTEGFKIHRTEGSIDDEIKVKNENGT